MVIGSEKAVKTTRLLRVSARENRAEAGRRGSADLHHISVGCCSYQSSNHDNIYFFIDIIVFKNRPPPQKSPKRGAERSDFRWTSQEHTSPFIQATDTSLHPHNTSPLPFQMNTRTNVFCSSLTFCTPTINALFVTFSENVKIHFFKWIFLGGPGRYKFNATCNVLTIYMENNLRQRLNWIWNFKFLTVRCL